MALPHELHDARRLESMRSFVRGQFVSLVMEADYVIHAPAEGLAS
ncbi:hypothetical protein CSIRO_4233 [Bradyrhizobiaceae bacterium SG-6C]|nr:hypothetical protein CSIRO_4233 [Bradyrhizobiaceae bacterium SG-6C]